MDFEILNNEYKIALQHYLDHRCGGVPYSSYVELYDLLMKCKPSMVLEVGSAIGFSSMIMAEASSESSIYTLEQNYDHYINAKNRLAMYKNISVIYADLMNWFEDEPSERYDLIFFDGYAPQLEFENVFYKLLKRGGVLVSANCHLKGKDGSTKVQYIENLHVVAKWNIIDAFEDTIVCIKI